MLFSSDDQAVPLGEEECEEEIGCPDQGGAGGEGAKDKPRGHFSIFNLQPLTFIYFGD